MVICVNCGLSMCYWYQRYAPYCGFSWAHRSVSSLEWLDLFDHAATPPKYYLICVRPHQMICKNRKRNVFLIFFLFSNARMTYWTQANWCWHFYDTKKNFHHKYVNVLLLICAIWNTNKCVRTVSVVSIRRNRIVAHFDICSNRNILW